MILDDSGSFFDAWTDLLNENHRALNIPIRRRLFGEAGYVFLAFDEECDLLAGERFLKRGKTLITHVAVSKRYIKDKKTISGLAHALLIWEAIKWAKENGFKEFDFGGYNPNKPQFQQINEWKASFGGVPVYRESL